MHDELLERAQAGDTQALEALLEAQQARIYRFALKLCRNPADAEDVLQETMLALAKGVGTLRREAALSTWLYAVARSYCLKKRRGPQATRTTSAEDDGADEVAAMPDGAPLPDEALAHKEVEQVLDAAIGALEPAAREVLLLRDVEGLSAPEVAEVLGIGVGAVKSRLHRARLAVRAVVAPRLGVVDTAPGAACPDVLTLSSRHAEGEITPAACAELQGHVAGCTRCRAACDSLEQTLTLCHRSAADTEVPVPVQHQVRVALRRLLAER